MRTTSRGFDIHYTADSAGPPLMLVAGTMLAARHWADLGYVDALATAGATLDVIPGGTHLSTYFGEVQQVLGAVAARLREVR